MSLVGLIFIVTVRKKGCCPHQLCEEACYVLIFTQCLCLTMETLPLAALLEQKATKLTVVCL